MDFSAIAEDFKNVTYSTTYDKPLKNKAIKLMERALVKKSFYSRATDLYEMVLNGVEVEEAILSAFDFRVQIRKGSLDLIPSEGPVLIVGNHPFGIVDGIVVAAMIKKVRSDLKVMAHQGVSDISIFSDFFLPISFNGSKEARITNKNTIKSFKRHLKSGGIGVIFPAGAVSTRRPLWKTNCDFEWQPTAAKWAREFDCEVQPMFIDGGCGPMFQIASQLSMTLRLGSLLRENIKLIDSEIGLRIGEPFRVNQLSFAEDSKKVTRYFREKCYQLADLDIYGEKNCE